MRASHRRFSSLVFGWERSGVYLITDAHWRSREFSAKFWSDIAERRKEIIHWFKTHNYADRCLSNPKGIVEISPVEYRFHRVRLLETRGAPMVNTAVSVDRSEHRHRAPPIFLHCISTVVWQWWLSSLLRVCSCLIVYWAWSLGWQQLARVDCVLMMMTSMLFPSSRSISIGFAGELRPSSSSSWARARWIDRL